MKWIILTSDEIKSGKTVLAAYIAATLSTNQIKINYIKLNPALSISVGLLSPEQVGEIFVTSDGQQVDKDIGIIERSVSYSLPAKSCLTLGRAVQMVNATEENSKDCCFDFLSLDNQLVDYLYQYLLQFSSTVINIVEIGGRLTDIGTLIFCQAVKRLYGAYDLYTIHVGAPGRSFADQFGREPSVFVNVLENATLRSRVLMPGLQRQIDAFLSSYLNIRLVPCNLQATYLCSSGQASAPPLPAIRLAIVGRYIANREAYLSLLENLRQACACNQFTVEFAFIQPLFLNDANCAENFRGVDGIVVPGGFGDCGNEGMISAIKHARTNDVPVIGLCYGFEMMVIEYARNVLMLDDANTTEIRPDCKNPIFVEVRAESRTGQKYQHMNLGDQEIAVRGNTLASRAFETGQRERNYNAYALNMGYWPELERSGLVGSIWSKAGNQLKGVELADRLFFFGCQFHPEFRGNYSHAHRIFRNFVAACGRYAGGRSHGGSVKE